jgi:predicted HTH domain antitoxin
VPDMTVGELRAELKERGIAWKVTEGQAELAAKLEAALAPA